MSKHHTTLIKQCGVAIIIDMEITGIENRFQKDIYFYERMWFVMMVMEKKMNYSINRVGKTEHFVGGNKS